MKNGRLTAYRSAVLNVLRGSHDHPTAAEVFRKVRQRRPGVAYATIYNALNWLKQNGMVEELRVGEGASRYDPIMRRHDHLICTRCGDLVDSRVELPEEVWTQAGRHSGFQVKHYRLEIFGLCKYCAKHR